jgi:hypothetical protein
MDNGEAAIWACVALVRDDPLRQAASVKAMDAKEQLPHITFLWIQWVKTYRTGPTLGRRRRRRRRRRRPSRSTRESFGGESLLMRW